jgi:biofilm PGA synthesis N-glycosyltransferase PgaC
MMTDTTLSIVWSFFFWITTIIFIIAMARFALVGNYERVFHGIVMSLIYVNFQMIAGIIQVLAALILDFNGAKLKYLAFAPIYLLFTWIVNPLTIVTTFVKAVRTIMGKGSGKWISPKRKVN